MSDLWNHWVGNWRDNHGLDSIRWKTTVGIGDSMYGLNIAYMRAFANQKPTKFQIHFFHPKDYVHHYEDPESVVERVEYIRSRYMWKDIVDVEYVFDSKDTALYKKFYEGITRRKNSELYRYWALDPTINTTPQDNKITLWRPSGNMQQQMSNSKSLLLDSEWQRLIDRLQDFMAKNLFKPHIVLSDSSITKWHTPAAVMLNKKRGFYIDRDMKKFEYYIEAATERAENYKNVFFRFVNGF